MRRIAAIAGAAAALLALTAGPALAQDGYGDPGGTSSTTTSSTTTTIPAGERVADVGPDVANPGDPVTFSSGAIFDPGTSVSVVFVHGEQGSTGIEVDEVVVNADGSVDATFTVPADTPPGVYFVYAEGVDPDGNPIRATVVLVVLAEGQAPTDDPPVTAAASASGASTSGDASPATEPTTSADAIEPPPEVQRLQLTPEAEQSLLEEVAAAGSGATVVIDGEQLSVSSGQESSTASPMTAGLAAGFLVLVGAIALRTRRNSRQ